MKIDTKSLCGHIRATCQGILNKDETQAFVGSLCSIEPTRFKPVVSQISKVFTEAMQGNFLLSKDELPNLTVSDETVDRVDYYGHVVKGTSYGGSVLDKLLSLPGNESSTMKVWAAMTNLKSALIIDQPTRDEKREAYHRIGEDFEIDELLQADWRGFVEAYIPLTISYGDISGFRRFNPLWSYPEAAKTGIACYGGELIKVPRIDPRCFDLVEQMRHPVVNALAHNYPEDFAQALILGYEAEVMGLDIPAPYRDCDDLPIGFVQIAPKIAQKPRIVFQPLLALDSACRPLFYKLVGIIDHLPTQGVFSHEHARELVRRHMAAASMDTDTMVYSFDQSAFTDRFSYDKIQRPILLRLRSLGVINDFDIACCDATCKGVYDSNVLRKGTTISFNGTGTPLGTPPSFMLASYSNDMLAAYSYFRVYGELPKPNVSKDNVKWIVVGDDIVIFDKLVAQEYEDLCGRIGLVINRDKTIASHHLAEFCGKMITKDDIFPKLKMSPLSGHDSLLELMDYYNPEALKAGWPELSDTIDLLMELPEPFGKRKIKDGPIQDLPPMDAYVKAMRLGQTLIEIGKTSGILLESDIELMMSRKRRTPHVSHGEPYEDREPRPELSVLQKSWIKDADDLIRRLRSSDLEKGDDLYLHGQELFRICQMAFPNDPELKKVSENVSNMHIALPKAKHNDELKVYNKLLSIGSLSDPSENDREEVDMYDRSI